jgi:hypothetical protein
LFGLAAAPLRPAGVQLKGFSLLSLLQIKRARLKESSKIEPAAKKSRVAKGQLRKKRQLSQKSERLLLLMRLFSS